MIINFSEKLESIQNDKRKKEILNQCILKSFIAVTQEVNSILMIMKNENISGADFLEYVEHNTENIQPHLLQRLTEIQGGNLVKLAKALKCDLRKQPQLSKEEIMAIGKQEKVIGADYFMNNDPIIVQNINDYIVELLEMDSI